MLRLHGERRVTTDALVILRHDEPVASSPAGQEIIPLTRIPDVDLARQTDGAEGYAARAIRDASVHLPDAIRCARVI
jgi:hypothetical protein